MLTFLMLSAVMIVGAIGVITLKQPVHAALSLVGTLLTLAVTYVTLQAHFLAAIQVIVYAGAIMVLFLFVIMLLNIEEDKPEENFAWMRPTAYGVAVVAALGIMITAFRSPSTLPDPAVISAALNGGGAAEIGEALFSEFVLAFQLVGVLLLTGIIGAVSLVQRKAVEVAELEPAVQIPSHALSSSTGGGVMVLERPADPESSSEVAPESVAEAVPVSDVETEAPSQVEEAETYSEEEILAEVSDQSAADPKSLAEEKPSEGDDSPVQEADAETRASEQADEDDTEEDEDAEDITPPESVQEPEDNDVEDADDPPDDENASHPYKPDDLTRIKGVGKKMAELLNQNEIFSFAQLAAIDADALKKLDEQMSVKGRIERDNWVGQAKQLMEEKNNG